MQEIQNLILQAGWIAIPLLGFSVLSLGLFLFVLYRSSVFQKQIRLAKIPSQNSKESLDTKREFSLTEEQWENESHPLVLATSWIASLAGLSTLVGLFGTVIGIQSSFRSMKETGQVSLDVFAGGVSLALSTTILGLGVAIPSYFLYQICRTKISGLEKNFFSKSV